MRTVFLAVVLAAAGCGDEVAECVDTLDTCYTGGCVGSTSPFCTCWNMGMDLSIGTCDCVPLELEAACETLVDLGPISEDTFDCAGAVASVENMCPEARNDGAPN